MLRLSKSITFILTMLAINASDPFFVDADVVGSVDDTLDDVREVVVVELVVEDLVSDGLSKISSWVVFT